MDRIFYWVLNASILGAAAGLIVLLLRLIRALPRLGVYLLWLLPLIRLWIPVGLSNKYSLLSLLSRVATKTIVVWEPVPGLPQWTVTNSIQAAQSYRPLVYKTDLLAGIFRVAGAVWAIVAAAALLCAVLLYIFTKSALKDAQHVEGNIYRSDRVLTPAVYGILRPKIILPATLADADLPYILAHERIHIRRCDNLWRVIAIVTACLHWFNPLAWVFLKYFFADMELACDAGVLKKLPDAERKAFAATLLSCAAGKTYYASAFGGAKTRLRIENILSYKKLSVASAICFAALLVAIAVTIITNATGG
ncbi:MAG: M56 family metallopeptidase [Clostridiales bacterium]|nr:M56 family metallopeptidase [Clostridiales bacterium]